MANPRRKPLEILQFSLFFQEVEISGRKWALQDLNL